MIKLENYEVMGWEHAIRGMRNPMNSWEKSDSDYCGNHEQCDDCPALNPEDGACNLYSTYGEGLSDPMIIGPNDHELMMKLAKGGSVHAKYRRMIAVYVDITAPLYWWKEFDTYKVGTVANSCSTMHKIHEKEFTLEDFSTEHLIDGYLNTLKNTIPMLNCARVKFLEAKTKPLKEESKRAELMKKYWWQMIQLLPSSYNQKRTVMLSYEVLANIYTWRKNHKLDEWPDFCKWIETLPYSEIITCKAETEDTKDDSKPKTYDEVKNDRDAAIAMGYARKVERNDKTGEVSLIDGHIDEPENKENQDEETDSTLPTMEPLAKE